MRSFTLLLLLLAVISTAYGKQSRRPSNGLFVQPSVGQPWPKPQSIQITAQQYSVHPDAFHFMINETSQTCDILTGALDRYFRIIFYPQTYMKSILEPESLVNEVKPTPKKRLADLRDTPMLKRLDVFIQQPCDQYPSLESNESCNDNFNSIF